MLSQPIPNRYRRRQSVFASALSTRLLPLALLLAGQATPSEIEVASVKEATAPTAPLRISGKSVALTGSLRYLVSSAYRIPGGRIRGLPGWADSKVFEVRLVATEPVLEEHVQPLIKAVLASRFGFSASVEEEDLPALIVTAGTEMKLPLAALSDGMSIRGAPGATPGAMALTARGVTMGQFFEMLSASLGQVFVDRTGLTEKYSFTLEFGQDMKAAGFSEDEPSGAASVYSALRGLGFKIARGRGKSRLVRVEHAELPTSN